jgi:hypothetical protein
VTLAHLCLLSSSYLWAGSSSSPAAAHSRWSNCVVTRVGAGGNWSRVALLAAVAALGLSVSTAAGFQLPAVRTGLDLDTSGNTATSVGNVDGCRSVAAGDTFDVDVWVEDVPAESANLDFGGLQGWSYNLLFDPQILEITAVDNKSQLASVSGNSSFDEVIDADATNGPTVDPLPATTGNLRVDFLIVSPPSGYPSGSGVLSRLTVKAISSGTSDLTLSDQLVTLKPAPLLIGLVADPYPIASVQNGIVAVGQPCPGAPTPLVIGGGEITPPAASVTPQPSPASVTPQSSPAPGQTALASAQATGSVASATPTDGGGGTGGDDTALIVGSALAAVVAAVAVGGGALYLLRKRRAS